MDEDKRQPVFGALCEIVEEDGRSALVSSARREVNLCRCPCSRWERTPVNIRPLPVLGPGT